MSRFLLAPSIGSKSAALVASTLLHGALAFAAARGAHGHARGAPMQPLEIDVEVQAAPEVVAQPHPDADDDHDHDAGTPAHHTHPYPVSPDHDAHPHDPRIDHRHLASPAAAPLAEAPPGGGLPDSPAAPAPVLAADSAPARFSMMVGTHTAAGVVGGVAPGPGGWGSSGGASGAEASEEIVPESGVSTAARPLVKIAPAYPSAAQAAGVEADVPLEIVVGTDGRVLDARVFRPAGFGFDEAARRAALASRFTPAERDGKRVRVRMRWRMLFHFEK